MGQSDSQHYQTQPLRTPTPIIWYESLQDHVKRLYKLSETPFQDPLAMVILAEVVCEAFTGWALEELFKKKNVEQLWNVLAAGKKYDGCRTSAMKMLPRFIQLYQVIE